MLDDASRVLAIACMLIASRNKGEIDGSEAGLAYLKRVAYLNKTPNLKPLILCGFLSPASGLQADASTMQSDAISEAYKERHIKKEEKEPPLPPKGVLVLPDWLPREQWEAYLDMRKSIKRPLTTHGLRLALAILSKLRDDGHDPTAILNQSTLNNWKGLFALKGEQNEIRQHDRNRERGGHLSAGTGNDKGTPGKYAHLGTVLDCGEED